MNVVSDERLLVVFKTITVDEFNGPDTSIGEAFAPLKKAFPEITTLTTAHIGTQYGGLVKEPVLFTSESMKTLSIDAVTPQTNYLPPLANITEVQTAGRQVWTYISVQPYKPYGDWRLDNPLVDARALFWLVSAFGFDGLLHWGLNQWSGTSSMHPIAANSTDGFISPEEWNMATSAGSWMQGDGKLIYCGEDGPLSSSRLVNIRDGMDDYDYIAMALAADKQAADQLVGRVSDGKCPYCAARNVSLLRSTREFMAQIIERSLAHNA